MFLLLLLPFLALAQSEGTQSGWDAYSALQNGNMRFYEGHATHQHQSPDRRESLAGAQKPHTIIISCSDSRLPPEIIFDQGLGDIFTVRVAGNTVTTEVIASVEYAVEHLGSKLLVVMGHESCGAVKAAVHAKPGISNGSESLDSLVNHIRGHLSEPFSSDPTMHAEVKANVTATLKELVSKSEIVAAAVRNKGLVLAQGIYSLKTGRVEFWDVGAKFDLAPGMSTEAPRIKEQVIQEEIIPAVAPAAPRRHRVNLR